MLTSGEVRRLKQENEALPKAVAETVVENSKAFKKFWAFFGEGWNQRMLSEVHVIGSVTLPSGGLRDSGPGVASSRLKIPRSIYYRWRHHFRKRGLAGLRDRLPGPLRVLECSSLPKERDRILEMALLIFPSGPGDDSELPGHG